MASCRDVVLLSTDMIYGSNMVFHALTSARVMLKTKGKENRL